MARAGEVSPFTNAALSVGVLRRAVLARRCDFRMICPWRSVGGGPDASVARYDRKFWWRCHVSAYIGMISSRRTEMTCWSDICLYMICAG